MRSSSVLILMATRDGARWLPEQLASIAAQDMQDWALHVADDFSRDETRDIIARFKTDHPERDIRLHNGRGRGAAQNFLSLLTHDDLPIGPATHIAFADQDDIWLPHKLSQALERVQAAGPEPVVYGAQSLHVDVRGRVIGQSRRPGDVVTLGSSLVRNAISGHSLVLNPAAVRIARAAGVPKVAFHDWWLGLVVLACGGRAVIDPERVLHYRQHGRNMLGGNRGAAAAMRRAAIVLRGDWKRWVAANLMALAGLSEQPNAPELTPEARALLAAILAAPARGCGRVVTFSRLGLRHEGRAEAAALALAAWTGLV